MYSVIAQYHIFSVPAQFFSDNNVKKVCRTKNKFARLFALINREVFNYKKFSINNFSFFVVSFFIICRGTHRPL